MTTAPSSTHFLARAALILLIPVFTMSTAWAQTETIDFSSMGFENGHDVTDDNINGAYCTISFDLGSNTYGTTPKYYDNGSAVRIYGGNTMTLTATDDYHIAYVDFTFDSGGKSNPINASTGTYAHGLWTGNATEVTFTIEGNSGHRRVRDLTVIYYSSIAPPVISGTTPFTSSTTVSISATEGTIYYTKDGSIPTAVSENEYNGPFSINATTVVKAITKSGDNYSNVSTIVFEKELDIWQGSGTQIAPYLIRNTSELDLLATRVKEGETYRGFYFKLANDIAYNYSSAWDNVTSTEENFACIGNHNKPFCGIFDGDGHTISGIRVCQTDSYNWGLFRYLEWAEIKNLTLTDCRFTIGDCGGAIVGCTSIGSKVENCHVMSDVCIHDKGSGNYHGGIVGRHYMGNIINCTSGATLSIDADKTVGNYGGITGRIESGHLTNCLALGCKFPDASFFSGNGRFCGAVVGYKNNGTVNGCLYYDCTFGNSSATTGIAGISSGQPNEAYPAYTLTTATTGMTLLYDGDGDEPNPEVVESYPSGLSYNGIFYAAEGSAVNFTPVVENNTVLDVTVSNGSLTNNHDGTYTLTMPSQNVTVSATLDWAGSGTADDPYIITTCEQLDILAQRVNNGTSEYEDTYFLLDADLNYNPTTEWNSSSSTENNYTPVGNYDHSFRGHFNGNGHTISGIRIYSDGNGNADSYKGLFGIIGGSGSVSRVTLSDTRITGYKTVGGIVGLNYGTVEYCHATNTVTICAVQSSANNHGGIAGVNDMGTVNGCSSAVTLTGSGSRSYGGIVGYNNTLSTSMGRPVVSNCVVIGVNVPTMSYSRPIVGEDKNSWGIQSRNYYMDCTSPRDGSTNIYRLSINGSYAPQFDRIEGTELKDAATSITIYNDGIRIGDVDYYTESATVSFKEADVSESGSFDFTVTKDGTDPTAFVEVTENGGNYSFTMPASDVTLNAVFCLFLADNADNCQTIGDNSGKQIAVQLTGRTLYKDGEWNTICLPFPIASFSGTPFDGATVKTLETSSFDTKTGTLTLNFSNDIDAIEAGKPYIVKWEGDGSSTITSPVFTDVVIPDSYSSDEAIAEALANASIETDHVVFIGTVSPVILEANDRSSLYLSGGSTLYYPAEDVVINSCRAYFTLNGITAGDLDGEVNAFVLNFDGETSFIDHLPLTIDHETIEHSPLTIDHSDGAWYSIDGRRLNGKPTAKGIYIKDGKKFVIK